MPTSMSSIAIAPSVVRTAVASTKHIPPDNNLLRDSNCLGFVES